MSKIFVLTDPEEGWDCVKGVYEAKSEYDLKSYLSSERGITIKEFEEQYILTEIDKGIQKC